MLKFLAIILFIFFILSILRRLLFFGAQKAFKKATEDMLKKQKEHEMQKDRKAEGSVTVEKLDGNNRRKVQDAETVDFEEIE